jgi:hypothetical protein
LHHVAREVAGWMIQGLVTGRHLQARRVIVDAEVGRHAAPPGGLHETRQGDAAVGIEQRLRGLDHELQPERPLRELGRRLQGFEDLHQGPDLAGQHHLGKSHDEAARQPAARLADQRPHEEVQGAGRALEPARVQGLDADPDEGWEGRRLQSSDHLPRGLDRAGVLLVIGAFPVAILEIDPKVFHRLALELLDDTGVDRLGKVRGQPDGGR